uniref:Uncharacterized protein n=1 Tax=Magallana gigas TaxID=29159 RepID=A0A8W8NTT0_MAGGI|nr:papilin isoform X1 [Crassostrea gigas]
MKPAFLVLLFVTSVLATYAPRRPNYRPVGKQKPGRCPVSNIITTCDCRPENIKCRGDQDCPGVQKCCSFGCGCRTRCVNPAGSPPRKVCRYNGKIYKVGQSFPAVDGCNTCSCSSNGRVRCTLRACVKVCRYHGKVYKVGQRFTYGYRSCRCYSKGKVICTKQGRPTKKFYNPRKVCYQPKVPGPCRGAIPRWWYNKRTGRCQRFIYGGCKGNSNNFTSKLACLRRCGRTTRRKTCRYRGKVYKLGQKFRSADGCNTCRCRTGGRVTCTRKRCIKTCKYNGKTYKVGQSFPARDGCNTCRCRAGGRVTCSRKKCVKYPAKGRKLCYQPKVVGPCKARVPRWWYSKKSDCCVKFYYGGCRGNGNNFKTRSACLRRCRRGGKHYG